MLGEAVSALLDAGQVVRTARRANCRSCAQPAWHDRRDALRMTESQAGMNDRHGSQGARFPLVLLAVFLVAAVVLGISPRYRQDWLMENVLVVLALPVLVLGFHRLRFSDVSYAALFVFLLLHEIGAHYTYSEVPWARWFSALCGFSLDEAPGLSRNHFDRAIHFAYGLLVTPAAVELVAARTSSPGLWRWIVPVSLMTASSTLYELFEWAAAVWFGGDLGVAYLGTQGDPWDAQQDMLLALLGSLVAVVVLAAAARHRRGRAASAPVESVTR
jgi:putative membrane protein